MLDRDKLRAMVRGAYDIQKLRIQMGNRIVVNFKSKLGIDIKEKEEAADKDKKKVINALRVEYRRITDGVASFPTPRRFKGTEIISEYSELVLLRQYISLEESEANHFRDIGHVLKSFPIYAEVLEKTKGVGPAMAGVIISELDPARAEYPSSFWKFAGLDVAEDGRGRSRRKEHLVKVEYINKDGEEAEKDSITFNPFLKTKLVGVLGPSFLRAKSPYSDVYYRYRHRIDNHPSHDEKTPGHRHNMATRYMIKRFLVDLHCKWRELEGLPVSEEYSEAKLGMKHNRAG